MNELRADRLKETLMLQAEDGGQYKYEIWQDRHGCFFALVSRLDALGPGRHGPWVWSVIEPRMTLSRQATLIAWAVDDALAHFEQHYR